MRVWDKKQEYSDELWLITNEAGVESRGRDTNFTNGRLDAEAGVD